MLARLHQLLDLPDQFGRRLRRLGVLPEKRRAERPARQVPHGTNGRRPVRVRAPGASMPHLLGEALHFGTEVDACRRLR